MESLSMHMIVRNNEATLERTLKSAKPFVDQIVVVDTGSTDRTRDIALEYGAEVYDFVWQDDFSVARNFALDQTTGEWVMWLDAGDVIPPQSIERFKWLRNKAELSPKVNVIWAKLNRTIAQNGDVIQSLCNARIARSSDHPYWRYPIHEEFTVDDPVALLDTKLVINDPEGSSLASNERNLAILQHQISLGDKSERTLFLAAMELEALGRNEEAADAFAEVLEFRVGRNVTESFIGMARCHLRIGNIDEARELLLEAVLHDPTIPDAFYQLGDMEYRRENWKSAIPYYHACVGMVKDEKVGSFAPDILFRHAPLEKLAY